MKQKPFIDSITRLAYEPQELWIARLKQAFGQPEGINRAIQINNLAYELEKQNPDLDFFEVNKIVVEVSKPKLRLVK